MSVTALGLVLFAALLHALWNVVAKRTGGDARFALMSALFLVDYVGNVFRVPFLLPSALRDRRGFREVWRAQWRAALVVAVLGPLGYVLVLYAVRLAPISHVAPAREVSMLFAALLGGRLL